MPDHESSSKSLQGSSRSARSFPVNALLIEKDDVHRYARLVPRKATLHFYGRPTEEPNLEWSWVESQLAAAGTYWVVARTGAEPHPRPVWGIWEQGRLYLSIGTPATVLALVADPVVTVHLDSGTDVVIVEGRFVGGSADLQIVAAYNEKYDWQYDLRGPRSPALRGTRERARMEGGRLGRARRLPAGG